MKRNEFRSRTTPRLVSETRNAIQGVELKRLSSFVSWLAKPSIAAGPVSERPAHLLRCLDHFRGVGNHVE